jgi:hypothetical protein
VLWRVLDHRLPKRPRTPPDLPLIIKVEVNNVWNLRNLQTLYAIRYDLIEAKKVGVFETFRKLPIYNAVQCGHYNCIIISLSYYTLWIA